MIYGNPGTGKTLIAVYFTSVQQVLTKHVGKSYRIRETQNMFKKIGTVKRVIYLRLAD